MAEYQEIQALTRVADADLSGAQYHFVKLVALGKTNIGSLATASTLAGVLLNNPGSAERAAIGFAGVGKLVAGAAITEGVFLTCNGSGRAVAAGSGDMVGARALMAAGADGEVITALYVPPFRWSGAA